MNQFDQRIQATYPTVSDEWSHSSHGLLSSTRAKVLRYLLLGWRAEDIVDECDVSRQTVYDIQANIMRYEYTTNSWYQLLGRPSKLTVADQKTLLDWLLHEEWRYQNEMIFWLWNECDVLVDQSTLSRLLKHNCWSWKKLRQISLHCSEKLHQRYHDEMRHIAADNMIFLDEFISNEKTSW